jgi:hypothetical protein
MIAEAVDDCPVAAYVSAGAVCVCAGSVSDCMSIPPSPATPILVQARPRCPSPSSMGLEPMMETNELRVSSDADSGDGSQQHSKSLR